eukprot:CAMPEP_0170473540 /NCGR_PEP_ID=MMETSP0123-20130129/15440_1 /TAXON_ID=182087 /ORGANISM="Favella ehrenbergii, Strain Fehren 1" /LENGTH=44 /DNA_ID= /DNA_START= /DNA_END= /DNA_ORIENTATION=
MTVEKEDSALENRLYELYQLQSRALMADRNIDHSGMQKQPWKEL